MSIVGVLSRLCAPLATLLAAPAPACLRLCRPRFPDALALAAADGGPGKAPGGGGGGSGFGDGDGAGAGSWLGGVAAALVFPPSLATTVGEWLLLCLLCALLVAEVRCSKTTRRRAVLSPTLAHSHACSRGRHP